MRFFIDTRTIEGRSPQTNMWVNRLTAASLPLVGRRCTASSLRFRRLTARKHLEVSNASQ